MAQSAKAGAAKVASKHPKIAIRILATILLIGLTCSTDTGLDCAKPPACPSERVAPRRSTFNNQLRTEPTTRPYGKAVMIPGRRSSVAGRRFGIAILASIFVVALIVLEAARPANVADAVRDTIKPALDRLLGSPPPVICCRAAPVERPVKDESRVQPDPPEH
jgi:hypothetical protein